VKPEGREREEFFTYESKGLSFNFAANRHNHDSGNLTSAYRVYLGLYLPSNITLEDAGIIATNIRQAPLILPSSKVLHNGEPPTAAVFDMSYSDKKHPEAPAGESLP
jgi:hypothetical protein